MKRLLKNVLNEIKSQQGGKAFFKKGNFLEIILFSYFKIPQPIWGVGKAPEYFSIDKNLNAEKKIAKH